MDGHGNMQGSKNIRNVCRAYLENQAMQLPSEEELRTQLIFSKRFGRRMYRAMHKTSCFRRTSRHRFPHRRRSRRSLLQNLRYALPH